MLVFLTLGFNLEVMITKLNIEANRFVTVSQSQNPYAESLRSIPCFAVWLKGVLEIILYLEAALLSYFQEMPAIQ